MENKFDNYIKASKKAEADYKMRMFEDKQELSFPSIEFLIALTIVVGGILVGLIIHLLN